MRNKKKEVTDKKIIEAILKEAIWCQLALTDGDQPYIVPLNYGYYHNALYIHCAPSGMKLDLIRKNPKAAFNVTLDPEYLEGLLTMKYRSVSGTGKAYIIEDEEGKREALNHLTGHFGAEPVHHSAQSLKTIVMIKVEIESTTCKISYMDK
ncbi:MAG TPA: pyridoxamine 5'-phosphate oxidase family protein [Clostridiales bacterium]|nr:pyridoxamine 5'-phosphate oxidase family protein [Clostridiales bacterium]HQP69277.1 pyridoxamine 5'-phosphate oxidase family protein [Clostridiales bacterium]